VTVNDFRTVLDEQAKQFSVAPLCLRLQNHDVTISDYHHILRTIFRQVQESATTFSMAAAHCSNRHFKAKSYLMAHAEEEKLHWQWILSDLAATGYDGPSPADSTPSASGQVYVAYNYYTAATNPIGRLAIAAVLENIGASYGRQFSTLIAKQLKLAPDQLQFFFGHGDTDVGHTEDILNVLVESNLTENEWAVMCNIGEIAGGLYRAMYA
jgi:hypothetical protein